MMTPRPPLQRTLALAGLAALPSACSHKPVESVATEEEVPVSVKPATLVPTFETTVNATGLVAAESGFDWTVTAPESARIAELPRSEGERVKAGDLLVRFEIPTLAADVTTKEADVAQASAKVDTAKAALARTTGLVERGIGAKKDQEAAALELAQAEAALKQAHAAVDAAYVLQGRAVVKARFPGIIAKRWHGAGDLVEAGGTVVRVIDPSRLEVVAAVTVGDLPHVSLGRPARIESAAGVEPEKGTVISAPARRGSRERDRGRAHQVQHADPPGGRPARQRDDRRRSPDERRRHSHCRDHPRRRRDLRHGRRRRRRQGAQDAGDVRRVGQRHDAWSRPASRPATS